MVLLLGNWDSVDLHTLWQRHDNKRLHKHLMAVFLTTCTYWTIKPIIFHEKDPYGSSQYISGLAAVSLAQYISRLAAVSMALVSLVYPALNVRLEAQGELERPTGVSADSRWCLSQAQRERASPSPEQMSQLRQHYQSTTTSTQSTPLFLFWFHSCRKSTGKYTVYIHCEFIVLNTLAMCIFNSLGLVVLLN